MRAPLVHARTDMDSDRPAPEKPGPRHRDAVIPETLRGPAPPQPQGSRNYREPGFAGAGRSLFIWRAGHGPARLWMSTGKDCLGDGWNGMDVGGNGEVRERMNRRYLIFDNNGGSQPKSGVFWRFWTQLFSSTPGSPPVPPLTPPWCLIAPTLLNLFYAAVLDEWRRELPPDIELRFSLSTGLEQNRARRFRPGDSAVIHDTIYADDTTLLSSSWEGMKRKWQRYVDVVGRFGLTIAYTKTKVLTAGADDTGGDRLAADPGKQDAEGPWLRLEHVPHFNLLGSVVQEDAGYDREVGARMKAAGAAWARMLPTCFHCRQLSRRLEFKIFAAFVLTRLLYAAELWRMTAVQLNRMQSFYNRCLRVMAGYNLWTMTESHVTDADIRRMLGARPLRELVDRACLRWFGHVARMSATRLPPQLLCGDFLCWPLPAGEEANRQWGNNCWWRHSHRVLQALRHFGIPSSGVLSRAQDAASWRRRIHGDGWTLARASANCPRPERDTSLSRMLRSARNLVCVECGYETPFPAWLASHASRYHPAAAVTGPGAAMPEPVPTPALAEEAAAGPQPPASPPADVPNDLAGRGSTADAHAGAAAGVHATAATAADALQP
eukprot:gene19349-biopygen23482